VAYLLVGGWAVGGGDGEVVEAEVDAELGAMVDEVVEEHAADGLVAGAVVDGLISLRELPGLVHGAVGGLFEERVGFGAVLVEAGEELGAGLHDERLAVGFGGVEPGGAEHEGEEGRKLRDVRGQLRHGHGLLVGLEVVHLQVLGNAFEDGAGLAKLLVKLGKEKVFDGHGVFLFTFNYG